MDKSVSKSGKKQDRKYNRWKIEVEMRKEHPIDREVIRILDSKKPDRMKAEFLRQAVLMLEAAEQGDFKPFLNRYGGQMLMQGLIGTTLPEPRQITVNGPIIAISEPPINSGDSAQNLFDLFV